MSAILERRLREARDRLKTGDLAGAERACEAVLKKAPRHPGALHVQGMVFLARGDAGEATRLIEAALEHDPGNPVALEHLGLACLAAGDFPAAESAFRRALGPGADHALLHMRLGIALLSQHRAAEAVAALRVAAGKLPDDPDVQLNLGNALAEAGESEEALACYRGIARAHPGRAADAYFNLGTQLRNMGRLEEAEAAFRAALAADPRSADAHHNLGLLYQQQGRADDAAASYRAALQLAPRHLQARNNLGNVLLAEGRTAEAERLFEAALADRPDYADASINLGNVRRDQGRYAEARALYERAIRFDPRSFDAHYNLGDALWALGDLAGAVECYERSLALNPGFGRADYNLGLVRLFQQAFEQGWKRYERRLDLPESRKILRPDPASIALYEQSKRWLGPGEAGEEEVAIWSEQGIGDQVLFSTLLPDLIAAGVPFLYEVDRRLLAAYQRAFPAVRFVPQGEPPLERVRQAPRVLLAGSLPGYFRRTLADFRRQPVRLLTALPDRVAHYRGQLARKGVGVNVALAWRSTRRDHLGLRKTAALADFVPLLKTTGAQFIDVQYGDTAAERTEAEKAAGTGITRFENVDYFSDLEELLAILEACDLVVTTSNATAHFAGALGKPAWLLHPAGAPPFHYWAHGGSHRSLWYPSVEIVSEPRLPGWDAVIARAVEKLGAING